MIASIEERRRFSRDLINVAHHFAENSKERRAVGIADTLKGIGNLF
jgi:hypothetical protein